MPLPRFVSPCLNPYADTAVSGVPLPGIPNQSLAHLSTPDLQDERLATEWSKEHTVARAASIQKHKPSFTQRHRVGLVLLMGVAPIALAGIGLLGAAHFGLGDAAGAAASGGSDVLNWIVTLAVLCTVIGSLSIRWLSRHASFAKDAPLDNGQGR